MSPVWPQGGARGGPSLARAETTFGFSRTARLPWGLSLGFTLAGAPGLSDCGCGLGATPPTPTLLYRGCWERSPPCGQPLGPCWFPEIAQRAGSRRLSPSWVPGRRAAGLGHAGSVFAYPRALDCLSVGQHVSTRVPETGFLNP